MNDSHPCLVQLKIARDGARLLGFQGCTPSSPRIAKDVTVGWYVIPWQYSTAKYCFTSTVKAWRWTSTIASTSRWSTPFRAKGHPAQTSSAVFPDRLVMTAPGAGRDAVVTGERSA
jgi:hypothetical protein